MEKEIDINKLQQELKKALAEDYFQKGVYCDAMDETRAWCVAEIKDRIDDKIKIHFEGWSNKFDDQYSIKSKKIDIFRRNSKGYSGQKITAYRTLNFNTSDYDYSKNLIKEIINSNFSCLTSPFEITQVLRGKLFTNIDILMTNQYTTNNFNNPINMIVDILYDTLDLIVTYLKFLKENLNLTEILEKYSDFYLINNNFAIVASLNEIMITLKRIFGKDERVSSFYKVLFIL